MDRQDDRRDRDLHYHYHLYPQPPAPEQIEDKSKKHDERGTRSPAKRLEKLPDNLQQIALKSIDLPINEMIELRNHVRNLGGIIDNQIKMKGTFKREREKEVKTDPIHEDADDSPRASTAQASEGPANKKAKSASGT